MKQLRDRPLICLSLNYFFSNNVDVGLLELLSDVLNVSTSLGSGKYLDLPSVVGRNNRAIFNFIKDRIWKKINSREGKTLSKAGREVFVKAVIQSIPVY